MKRPRRTKVSKKGVKRKAARPPGPSSVALARLSELASEVESLRAQARLSQRRADHIALLNSVIRQVAPLLEPDRLMQVAAQTVQERMNYNFVAVTVLDSDGFLVGRWAGREGVSRTSAGRTQGPAGGIIGRAVRRRAPQVVSDVRRDPDYHRDVAGTRSEMVVPLVEEGGVIGALDFQSDQIDDFGLDDVATGETLAEFLVVALRNARLVDELKRSV